MFAIMTGKHYLCKQEQNNKIPYKHVLLLEYEQDFRLYQ